MKKFLLSLLAGFALTSALPLDDDIVRYDGHKVFRVSFSSEDMPKIAALKEAGELSLDFWKEPNTMNDHVDIRVVPEFEPIFTNMLKELNLNSEVMIDDVQTLIDAERTILAESSDASADWFSAYHTYDEIVAWTQQLQTDFPDLAQVFQIATSYENRPIYAVKISSSVSSGRAKPQVFYDGGLHAREWVSPAVVQYIAYELLSKYGKDSAVTRLVDEIEWTIIPLFNVDGYVYTLKDRMWRKTRSPNTGSSCVGTDPNRNWNFHFGEAGASKNPCADDYHGPSAFSEIEVKTVADYLGAMPNLKSYINFHAYSQLWMSPWGYSSSLPTDYAAMDALGAKACDAIKAVHGVRYSHGSISNIIYSASGSSVDWAYGIHGIKYSYGVELRDTGRYGFMLPADQIIPSGEETFAAVKVMGDIIIAEGL
eukprot:TRINITY_DN1013_c0_g1::TRINITY_DN1013_c0_g1_i1::g.29921::m.29921 TRINITY_DN1013_c0_g1::TRINITY_DN1013_c0_g1_i1::g.29921  ORF type:complete len:439 (+),score=148.58,sp/P48052/CBPA2_HUMAN/42.35/1e-105,Peptidase_M14/PF00246.19/3.9e-82,Propep_M14/PF02244.11/5.1e-15 TRINITY_DN1013_c0_g1_i1:45-1319(+)